MACGSSSEETKEPSFLLKGIKQELRCLVKHPFLPILILSGTDGLIYIWDLDSRSLLHTLSDRTGSILDLSLCPHGKYLTSGSSDNTVRIWDFVSGTRLHTFTGHTSHVRAVVWDASGSLIASGSDDNTIRLWHADSGALQHTLEGHTRTINKLVAHPTDDLFASGSYETTVRVWRWSSGAQVHTLVGHTNDVCSLEASATWLVSGSYDRTMRVWSWESGECVRVLDGFWGWIRSMTWNDSTLVSVDITCGHKSCVYGGCGFGTGYVTVRKCDTSSADPLKWSFENLFVKRIRLSNGGIYLDKGILAKTCYSEKTIDIFEI